MKIKKTSVASRCVTKSLSLRRYSPPPIRVNLVCTGLPANSTPRYNEAQSRLTVCPTVSCTDEEEPEYLWILRATNYEYRKKVLVRAINAFGVGKVVASGHPDFEKGDLVAGFISWGEYTVVKGANMLNKLDLMGFPPSYHVGILASSGLTAYVGFFKVCKPKKGEKVFVSAASGSVGNLVGQYTKLFGCYVVGCAGSKQKVELLKEKLGFDDAFNYKEETDLESALKRYFPDGIDIYFDNVGAEMLEAAVANMKTFGRVAVSGVISEYTDTAKRGAPNMLDVVYKRITVRGFLVSDHMNLFADFISMTADHLRKGEICVLEDISQGLESLPAAFTGLFRGDNVGKKIVQILDE